MLIPQTKEDSARWKESRSRRRMLEGVWEPDVLEEMKRMFSTSRIASFGKPSMSCNLFKSVVQQLAVQYNTAPTVSHEDPQALIAINSILSAGHYWEIAKTNSEYVVGLRESFVEVFPTDRGIRYELVPPDEVIIEIDPSDANYMTVYKRAKSIKMNGKYFDGFEVWDLIEQRHYFEDSTGKHLKEMEYWAIDELGQPFLPVVRFRALHNCKPWDAYTWSELREGTLEIAVMWTAWMRILKDASWPQRYIIDLLPVGADVDKATKTTTIETDPTSILAFTNKKEGTSGTAAQFSAGGDPKLIADAIVTKQSAILDSIGIAPNDVQTTSSQSGVAIYLKRSVQRELARSYLPNLSMGDLEVIKKSCIISNKFYDTSLPIFGYSVSYNLPKQSAEEANQELQQDLKEVELGIQSKVDLIIKRFPDMNREAAIEYLLLRQNETKLLGDFQLP